MWRTLTALVAIATMTGTAAASCQPVPEDPPDSAAFLTVRPDADQIGPNLVAKGGDVKIRVLEHESIFGYTYSMNGTDLGNSGDQNSIVDVGSFPAGTPLSFTLSTTLHGIVKAGGPPTDGTNLAAATTFTTSRGSDYTVVGFEDGHDMDYNDARFSLINVDTTPPDLRACPGGQVNSDQQDPPTTDLSFGSGSDASVTITNLGYSPVAGVLTESDGFGTLSQSFSVGLFGSQATLRLRSIPSSLLVPRSIQVEARVFAGGAELGISPESTICG